MLEGRLLSRRIGERYLLRDVSLHVAPGRIMGILGPSGCGKTTLLRLLSMLDVPDAGEVVFEGRSYAHGCTDEDGVFPGMAVVAQNYPLWPHLSLSAFETMTTGNSEMLEHWKTLGLEGLIHRLPAQLSAGQRQRAALALALSVKPKVLLLDEITSAQDVEHCAIIADLLRSLAGQGVSVVLSTHLLRFVAGVADDFVFLDHGQMIESGPIQRLENPQTDRLKKFMFVAG